MKQMTLNQFRIMNVTVWLGYLALTTTFLSPEWTSQPYVKAAVAAMAHYIPMLDSIRAIPGVNDWIRTFYAGVWLLVPFYILSGWHMRKQECRERREFARSVSDPLLILNVLIMYPLSIWMMLYWPIPDVQGWRDRSVVGGFFGLAHTAFIVCGCSWMWGLIARNIFSRVRMGHVNEYLASKPKN